ncbi:anaphase-promoting complex subunit cdc26 [Anaeramoeba flamelloides]|uniref:Anaphase-promoting complex subunit cdc26 n=1 Tax=Anaeramoeba flamelloides TaxID=1746091 RepID=A0AAV8AAY6_9EUKA|nr:anaphase-promoting complex subunit cdc26 [Anaeramoeba flamelloides]KAJ6230610.1 anaphase-promoting complex subunit cdc26 [Anaeramoeba flamelloides]
MFGRFPTRIELQEQDILEYEQMRQEILQKSKIKRKKEEIVIEDPDFLYLLESNKEGKKTQSKNEDKILELEINKNGKKKQKPIPFTSLKFPQDPNEEEINFPYSSKKDEVL